MFNFTFITPQKSRILKYFFSLERTAGTITFSLLVNLQIWNICQIERQCKETVRLIVSIMN